MTNEWVIEKFWTHIFVVIKKGFGVEGNFVIIWNSLVLYLFCKYVNVSNVHFRQLEDELQAKEKEWRAKTDEWRAAIDKLQEEVHTQQKLLSVNLSKPPQSQNEAYMQHEIARVVNENLVCLDKVMILNVLKLKHFINKNLLYVVKSFKCV